jgi:hypothetical protein
MSAPPAISCPFTASRLKIQAMAAANTGSKQ